VRAGDICKPGQVRKPLPLRSKTGFTLIELLVVILIIGVLVAVSAPSFLGQTQKAQDSAAKQYLSVAYRSAKAATVSRDGSYGTAADVVSEIAASEPELDVQSGSCPADTTGDPRHIVVDSAFTGVAHPDDLLICNDPTHTVWYLKVDHGGPVQIYSDESAVAPTLIDQVTGSGSGTQNNVPQGPPPYNESFDYNVFWGSPPGPTAAKPVGVHVLAVSNETDPQWSVSTYSTAGISLPSGFTPAGNMLKVSTPVPDPSAYHPIDMVIYIDQSAYQGLNGENLGIFRNGVMVPECSAPNQIGPDDRPESRGLSADRDQHWDCRTDDDERRRQRGDTAGPGLHDRLRPGRPSLRPDCQRGDHHRQHQQPLLRDQRQHSDDLLSSVGIRGRLGSICRRQQVCLH
jgi:prepilin-type N-terminal cleavage/methylation domain-containing protein